VRWGRNENKSQYLSKLQGSLVLAAVTRKFLFLPQHPPRPRPSKFNTTPSLSTSGSVEPSLLDITLVYLQPCHVRCQLLSYFATTYSTTQRLRREILGSTEIERNPGQQGAIHGHIDEEIFFVRKRRDTAIDRTIPRAKLRRQHIYHYSRRSGASKPYATRPPSFVNCRVKGDRRSQRNPSYNREFNRHRTLLRSSQSTPPANHLTRHDVQSNCHPPRNPSRPPNLLRTNSKSRRWPYRTIHIKTTPLCHELRSPLRRAGEMYSSEHCNDRPKLLLYRYSPHPIQRSWNSWRSPSLWAYKLYSSC